MIELHPNYFRDMTWEEYKPYWEELKELNLDKKEKEAYWKGFNTGIRQGRETVIIECVSSAESSYYLETLEEYNIRKHRQFLSPNNCNPFRKDMIVEQ